MDLKRLRTFVEVADLGTVSKAALHLRISQSALSRQISDLEYECGFKLFDRIGRRLFLTTRGEQLLSECRGVLGQIASLGERIELLKRSNSGVLKLAAPPQTIESVLVGFRRCCGPIATGSRSPASPTGESRCATVTSFSGTGGAPCRAMRRIFARRLPPTCARPADHTVVIKVARSAPMSVRLPAAAPR